LRIGAEDLPAALPGGSNGAHCLEGIFDLSGVVDPNTGWAGLDVFAVGCVG